jgi:deoxyribodipyrimidine photo-lyase
MTHAGIQEERIRVLVKPPSRKGKHVIYWMQASQRTEYNHALEYAIRQANELSQALIVFFGITSDYPEANERHYYFMLQGLREVEQSLKARGIQFVIQHVSPEKGILEISKQASCVIVDRGYTRIQREWRMTAARKIHCPLIEIESDVIVPVETVSWKEEYAAKTIRSKIHQRLSKFLTPLSSVRLIKKSLSIPVTRFSIKNLERAMAHLKLDGSVKPVLNWTGGTSQAKKLLKKFIKNVLTDYAKLRNDPNEDGLSCMSPYLHFGQISPLYIALEISKAQPILDSAYLEELIIRRELSMNFVYYNPQYDDFSGLPSWCQRTLLEHQKDKREYLYTLKQFESGKTHDSYWNAAQLEMVHTGKMHGYMRMYWGKKIIEWTETPVEAFKIALYLNNKYELDGRDPNGFTGVAWCFGKHDRPWAERPIFGKIRYMNAQGLKRKFDADAYRRKIQRLLA